MQWVICMEIDHVMQINILVSDGSTNSVSINFHSFKVKVSQKTRVWKEKKSEREWWKQTLQKWNLEPEGCVRDNFLLSGGYAALKIEIYTLSTQRTEGLLIKIMQYINTLFHIILTRRSYFYMSRSRMCFALYKNE